MLHGPVNDRREHQILFTDKLGEVSAEALLEAEQTVERVILGDVSGYAAEIVDPAAGLDGPLDHAPLQ